MGSETILNAIANQEWIDAAADPLQKAIREAFPGEEGRKVKNLLHGTWLGHPLHPVLTDIPIGAWTVALVLDALDGISGNKQLRAGADAAVGIGLLGAVGSAVTGMTDWSETDGRGKKLGLMHAGLNIIATSLYTASWILRKSKSKRQSGIAFSMLGFAIAGASGYLGGHLVGGEQIGVDHTATPDSGKPEKFTAVIADSDLRENQLTRVEAGGVAIVLVKRKDRIFALTETCPHLGGPLSEGKLVGDAIQCPWHQSELALEDGHVVNGPTTYPARCFDVRVRSGQVEVRAANK
jgi:nitrite reductase/ring-hydroxylating ferredoxin subunit/uncharacterized membrane protein